MPGFRQRLERAARSRTPPPTSTGGLARRPAQLRSWLSSWAWGQKTAADVVRDARSALEDIGREVVDPQLRRLARCSVNLGNAERVVESVLPDAGLCHPVHVEDSLIEWVLQPHRVLPWLANTSSARFNLHLGASAGGVQEFWEAFF